MFIDIEEADALLPETAEAFDWSEVPTEFTIEELVDMIQGLQQLKLTPETHAAVERIAGIGTFSGFMIFTETVLLATPDTLIDLILVCDGQEDALYELVRGYVEEQLHRLYGLRK